MQPNVGNPQVYNDGDQKWAACVQLPRIQSLWSLQNLKERIHPTPI